MKHFLPQSWLLFASHCLFSLWFLVIESVVCCCVEDWLFTKQVTARHSAAFCSCRHTFQQETTRVILSTKSPFHTSPARNTGPNCHEQTYLHSWTCLKSDPMNEAILSRFDTLGREMVIILNKEKEIIHLNKKQISPLEQKDEMLSRKKEQKCSYKPVWT